MKANFRNSFAKRSLVIAATALPSLYCGLASAQAAAPAPAAPAAAPALPAPIAGSTAPVAGPVEAPAVVTPAAPATPPAPAAMPPAIPPPEPPPDPMAEKYKHINMGIWMRVDGKLQNGTNPKKLDGFGSTGELELHFSNQMRKYVAWTANIVASYNAAAIDGSTSSGNGNFVPNAASGTVGILDLIAQFEPDPAFNVWVGRMLVPSDRSNFSGPYFMGPWNYPLFVGPYYTGPQEGPSGRNDGATAWGQFGGGAFKYYAGVFHLNSATQKPLLTARLNLDLLSPEPGFYHSSTYYGSDILAIGMGGQYSKNADANPAAADGLSDYGLFNADALFEKNLGASGVVDVEGAFFKYVGDGQALKWSHFVLASYLTPEVTGIGKFQPLVRVQQAIPKPGADTVTQLDAQVGYVVDSYATRFALGFTHIGGGGIASNAVFAGVQLQK